MDFEGIVDGLGVDATSWVAGVFLLWLVAKWAVQTDLLGLPARRRRQRRADLAESYERRAAMGPIDEVVQARYEREMALALEGGPAMWCSSEAEESELVESEPLEEAGGAMSWEEFFAFLGLPAWMGVLHRGICLGGAAIGYLLVAGFVLGGACLSWVLVEEGAWLVGGVFGLVPLAFVRWGFQHLAKRFPARFGFFRGLQGAWFKRTKRVREIVAVLKNLGVRYMGSLFVILGGAMAWGTDDAPWAFGVACVLAGLWGAKVYVEGVALQRARAMKDYAFSE